MLFSTEIVLAGSPGDRSRRSQGAPTFQVTAGHLVGISSAPSHPLPPAHSRFPPSLPCPPAASGGRSGSAAPGGRRGPGPCGAADEEPGGLTPRASPRKEDGDLTRPLQPVLARRCPGACRQKPGSRARRSAAWGRAARARSLGRSAEQGARPGAAVGTVSAAPSTRETGGWGARRASPPLSCPSSGGGVAEPPPAAFRMSRSLHPWSPSLAPRRSLAPGSRTTKGSGCGT